jgi:hypothetical protein
MSSRPRVSSIRAKSAQSLSVTMVGRDLSLLAVARARRCRHCDYEHDQEHEQEQEDEPITCQLFGNRHRRK